MTEGADVQRLIGGVEARTTILETRFAIMETRLDQRLDKIDQRVADIHEAVTSARGGWAAVAWLGGAAATIAAVVTAIYHFVFAR